MIQWGAVFQRHQLLAVWFRCQNNEANAYKNDQDIGLLFKAGYCL